MTPPNEHAGKNPATNLVGGTPRSNARRLARVGLWLSRRGDGLAGQAHDPSRDLRVAGGLQQERRRSSAPRVLLTHLRRLPPGRQLGAERDPPQESERERPRVRGVAARPRWRLGPGL